jgi:DNA-binding helix-hairpin-helix protein with protein kinase domain
LGVDDARVGDVLTMVAAVESVVEAPQPPVEEVVEAPPLAPVGQLPAA